jgi:hypothetical protein
MWIVLHFWEDEKLKTCLESDALFRKRFEIIYFDDGINTEEERAEYFYEFYPITFKYLISN